MYTTRALHGLYTLLMTFAHKFMIALVGAHKKKQGQRFCILLMNILLKMLGGVCRL